MSSSTSAIIAVKTDDATQCYICSKKIQEESQSTSCSRCEKTVCFTFNPEEYCCLAMITRYETYLCKNCVDKMCPGCHEQPLEDCERICLLCASQKICRSCIYCERCIIYIDEHRKTILDTCVGKDTCNRM